MHPLTKKQAYRFLLVTAAFDSAVAVVMNDFILKKNALLDVFVVSQFIGLSLWSAVAIVLRRFTLRGVVRIVAVILGAMTLGILVGSALSYLYLLWRNPADTERFFSRVFYFTGIFGFVFGVPIVYVYASLNHIRESEKQFESERIRRLTMEKHAALTSLRLLQAQIEPHFLFNTLSNVLVLLDADVPTAKAMLTDLNEYFRISLQRTRNELTTLGQELDLVRRYLNILKIRMGPRLTYSITTENAPGDTPFPPLTIQPLVENSIKYGLEPCVEGGTIDIDCRIQSGTLTVRVADTGMSLESHGNKAGIGIDNVTRRLEALYGPRASLTLRERAPAGVEAVIEVPA
jgi:sensor histidine kinase YesM